MTVSQLNRVGSYVRQAVVLRLDRNTIGISFFDEETALDFYWLLRGLGQKEDNAAIKLGGFIRKKALQKRKKDEEKENDHP